MIYKTFQYKLKLSSSQIKLFDKWLGVTRLIYNLVKETSEATYQATGKSLSAYDAQKQIVQMKKEYDWMMELPKDTLVEPTHRYQTAMRRFYNGAKYPKWAKKKSWNSLVFVQQNWKNKSGGDLRIGDGKIKLQKNIFIKYFNSRPLPVDTRIKRIVITKRLNGWVASIQFETNNHEVIPPNDNQVVGVDMGVAKLATLSTGYFYDNPKAFELCRKKIRIAHRSMDRKKRGSNSYVRQVCKLAKLHQKASNIRVDFQNKASSDIAKKYSGVIVENLKIENLVRSAKGTVERPGKNVKAKSGLNRVILDASIGGFLEKLEYKCKWNERYFEKVAPAYTSQECNLCGHTSRQNRITQSLFLCMNCGHSENADVNAAKNILKRGGHSHCSLTWNNSSSVGQKSDIPNVKTLTMCKKQSYSLTILEKSKPKR